MMVAERPKLRCAFLTVLLAFAYSSAACSDKPRDEASNHTATSGVVVSDTGYCDPTDIVERSCSGVACHGRVGKPAEFNTDLLNPPAGQTLGQSLLGRPANYDLVVDPEGICPRANPELLIHPSVPAESLILKKILGTQTCGQTMPNTTAASRKLSDTDVACFVDWVNGVITASGGTVTSNTSATGAPGTSIGIGTTTGGGTTAGATTGGTDVPATFETVVLVLTTNQLNCISSDCHGGFAGHIDFRADAGLHERLTTSRSEICGKLIVSPGNPEQSALIEALETGCKVTPECEEFVDCLPRMPWKCQEGFDCISPNHIQALRQWIAGGALPQ